MIGVMIGARLRPTTRRCWLVLVAMFGLATASCWRSPRPSRRESGTNDLTLRDARIHAYVDGRLTSVTHAKSLEVDMWARRFDATDAVVQEVDTHRSGTFAHIRGQFAPAFDAVARNGATIRDGDAWELSAPSELHVLEAGPLTISGDAGVELRAQGTLTSAKHFSCELDGPSCTLSGDVVTVSDTSASTSMARPH